AGDVAGERVARGRDIEYPGRRRERIELRHLSRGVAARLDVAGPAGRGPADETTVAAVLGRSMHDVDRVPEHQRDEVGCGRCAQQGVLLVGRRADDALQAREPLTVALLQTDDLAGEAAFGTSLRALDPDAPSQLRQCVE